MNSVEARTRIEGLLDKRDELLNDVAAITAKAIAAKSQKGNIDMRDIDTLLKDFTSDEKYLILARTVMILGANSNLKAGGEKKNVSTRQDTSSIFAKRGYN